MNTFCRIEDLLDEAATIIEEYEDLSLINQSINAGERIGMVRMISIAKKSLSENLCKRNKEKYLRWKLALEGSIEKYDETYL